LKHIVVFASGSGSNFQAIIDGVESEQINAEIKGLISNKKDCRALVRAEKHKINTRILNPSDFDNYTSYINKLEEVLKSWNPDLIVLAGYLLKIPERIINLYKNRIINIHPSLLPKYGGKGFYGDKVHREVLENREKETGCTVHLVTEEYDKGPVLAQRKVPVYESDNVESLAERVLKQEHNLLPEVVSELIETFNSNT